MINKEVVDKAFSHLAHPADYEYFFDSINSPEWIAPLREKKCFSFPPQPKTSEGYIQFPYWEESRFLARMAAKTTSPEIQKLIVQIALDIPGTENVRIHEDIAEIALAVIPSLGKKLVPKIIKCLESQHQLLLPKKLGPLIKKFAEAGEEKNAFSLAGHALKIIPDNRRSEEAANMKRPFDQYRYKEALKIIIPALTQLNPEHAFDFFFTLLKTALDSKYGKKDLGSDLSYIWRPSIEESKYNRYEHGIKFFLVDAVRIAAETLAAQDIAKVMEIVDRLESGKWTTFDRIALYLLRIYPEAYLETTKSKIKNISLYDDLNYQYEYFCLANNQIHLLTSEERLGVYKNILVGPDLERWKENAKVWEQEKPTDAELELQKNRWIRNRLSIFKDCMDTKTQKIYQDLVDVVGEPPESVGLPVQYRGVTSGPVSPKTAEDLNAMGIEDLVQYLKDWVPGDGFMEPDRRGLGIGLEAAVKIKPDRFFGNLNDFIELDPDYLWGLVSGIDSSEFTGSEIIWDEVLGLCSSILEKEKGDKYEESSWQSLRNVIVRLIRKGFTAGKSEIPFALREKAFKVLLILTNDPDPVPERDDDGNDPFHIAINSIRGTAMEGVVSYGLWVKKHILDEDNSLTNKDVGFNNMPEVKDVLEYHLNTSNDPSLAIRSTYGAYIRNLRYLDSDWVETKKDLIFPIGDSGDIKYFDAAWAAYILFGGVDTSLFHTLENQYRFFSNHVVSENYNKWLTAGDVAEHYANHLMIFYVNGLLALDDAMLDSFLEKISPSVRANVMWQVGHWVNADKETPSELHDMSINYWNSRLDKAKNSDDLSVYEEELNNFGWWVKSKHLKPEWVMDQILEVLRLIGKIDPDYQVSEFIEEHAEEDMLKTLKCIDLIFRGDKEGWGLYSWMEPSQRILKNALGSGNEQVQTEAKTLQGRFVAKGHRQFRNP